MLLLDYKKGGGKKPIKQGLFLAIPFLREEKEGRKEERGQRSLKTGRKLFHFWGPKFSIFQIC